MSKPIFYTFGLSIWSAVPELAIVELGYQSDAFEEKVINLVEGENFNPSFLKINPNATLPTLVADGKSYTNTADVTRYLIDHAPKKVALGKPALITRVHEDSIDPNFPLFAARDEETRKANASGFAFTFANNRQNALLKYSKTPEAAPFKAFYDDKIKGNGGILAIYAGQASEDVKQGFFKTSQQHFKNIANFILKELPGYLPDSGFIDGEVPGEDDFHVGAWLARIALVSGGTQDKDGYKALEKELGEPVPAKVAAYWAAWSERPGWKQVYANSLR
ncbi:hypothetical protein EIP91_004696 [Steccherinum ochraceum]|uniref:GST N-terminal domain-containing protein n=1 Tax=Steccherinum ochraceum TaxID=92696 RepID=A0A4R0RNR0_9APHY|nr:hypothetical protein EIP91_004696 [Steccherinum ochraceum]